VATKNVNIDIIAKDKTQKAMQSATKGVNNLKNNVANSVQSQQKSFTALGGTIKTVLGGLVVFQTARFASQMVQMTSAVEEMQSKSSVVFGQFVRNVRAELEKFGDNVGRSTHELESMASSIQDTFVPMGFAREEASKLSIQLTKLAVDVASFNNASDTETMMAFQSALVGNHETVRRFGVVITEATLKQELLRMGINKTATEVTNAEKVQARLNLIIAGTSDAQGDAERTSDSFANSMKALSSEFQEFMVEAVTPMLPALSKMVQSLKDSIIETKEFLRNIGLLSKLNEVVPIVDQLSKSNEELSEVQKKLAHETKLLDAIQNMTYKEKLKEFAKANGEFGVQIMQGEELVRKRIKALKEEINILNKNKEMIILESEARTLNTNAIKNQTEAQKTLNKEKEKEKLIQEGLLISDASMGKVPVNAHLNTFSEQERLEGLKNIANQEFEVVKQSNDNKIKAIMENDEFQLELQRIHSEKKIKLAQETANKQLEIEKKLMQDNFDAMKTGQFQNMKLTNLSKEQEKDIMIEGGKQILEGIKTQNKKAFALNKAYNMAVAIQNTAQGVSKALASNNIPMAILIGAMGAVQVATIANTKYQGRRLGGRMNQGQPYMVGEAGAELVVPDRPSNVVPNSKLPNAQPVTVNFNINTVDARGFNELLVNSRGTIVSLINGAVNEKGKMAII
tara:strand:- start:626 stop:2674 length:2049 start_codon:yes stop_codon:yes gene_type:complete